MNRVQVIWVGNGPDQDYDREFRQRRLVLKVASGPISEGDIAASCAIVFAFDPRHKGESFGLVDDYFKTAADHGLYIFLKAEQPDVKLLRARLKIPVRSKFEGLPAPQVQFVDGQLSYEIAENAARHLSGGAYNGELILKGATDVDAAQAFLLKRSFGDCAGISVRSMNSGLSGAKVFEVHAELPQGDAGQYPLPYFAKIDTSERIVKEYDAYDRFVTRYVPFNLRPNLDLKRCLLGFDHGILVGDLVDKSVGLAEVIRLTGARSVIHSLFDDALRGWRQQAVLKSGDRARWGEEMRSSIFHPGIIKKKYVELAIEWGSEMSPTELVTALDKLNEHSYRLGPQHGDLTTQNVRVRNGEAILIDFYKTRRGPLIADLASLEVAICFSVEIETPWRPREHEAYRSSKRFEEWRNHIDDLFCLDGTEFCRVPPVKRQPCEYDWMWDACRELRMMATYLEPEENAYRFLLAAYMLRLTMFGGESEIDPEGADANVRAYSYATAERLIRGSY